jgi:hypothetical protein
MIKHAASADEPEQTFMRAIAEEAQSRHIDVGLAWDWYARVAKRPMHIKTWLLDVAPPEEEAR